MKFRCLIVFCLPLCILADAQDEVVPDWQTQMEQKLKRTVTFEFTDTALDEAVSFMRQVSGVTIVIDRAPTLSPPHINLSVNNCPLKDALEKMLAPAGLEYLFADEAVFIFEKGKYAKANNTSAPALSSEAEKTLEQAVPQLRDGDFATREQASKLLADLGPGAVPKLHAALKSEADAEARERLARIINSYVKATLNDVSPEAAALLDTYTRKITFEFVDQSLEDAVLFVSQLAKNAKFSCDAKVMNIPVTLRVSEMPIGVALRWIARLSGTRIVADGDALKFEEKPAKK
jgi:hypothetical protein